MALHGKVYESDQSDIRGPIRVNHHKIGEWQAVCQPGKDGIHPYRWGATLNGVTVRGVLTHTRADGALVLASKVTAAAATALAEATRAAESPAGAESHNPTLETGVAQGGHGGPEDGTPDLVAALRESIERARERRRTGPRPEFQALIDAFQPEYDALLADRAEGES